MSSKIQNIPTLLIFTAVLVILLIASSCGTYHVISTDVDFISCEVKSIDVKQSIENKYDKNTKKTTKTKKTEYIADCSYQYNGTNYTTKASVSYGTKVGDKTTIGVKVNNPSERFDEKWIALVLLILADIVLAVLLYFTIISIKYEKKAHNNNR